MFVESAEDNRSTAEQSQQSTAEQSQQRDLLADIATELVTVAMVPRLIARPPTWVMDEDKLRALLIIQKGDVRKSITDTIIYATKLGLPRKVKVQSKKTSIRLIRAFKSLRDWRIPIQYRMALPEIFDVPLPAHPILDGLLAG